MVDIVDRAIWATWYDLPEDGREEFIDWLHKVYIPRELQRPGILWAAHYENDVSEKRRLRSHKELAHTPDPSVPTGYAYLLLFGAPLPMVFLNPSPNERRAVWSDEERKYLGRQIGVRSSILMEHARVEGLDMAKRGPGLTLGPVIQVGSFNINAWENEEELVVWFAKHRMPRMVQSPGCIGTRNLISICGWAKHVVIYEFVSLETIEKTVVKEDWEISHRVVGNLVHAPNSSCRGIRIWPPVKDS